MHLFSAKRIVIAVICLLLPLGLLALPRSRTQPVTPPNAKAPTVPNVTKPLAGSRDPWTLAEAREALRRQPDDGYLQYVVLQLARQEGRLAEVYDDIPLFANRRADRPVELFGLFTSTQTLQQELQLATFQAAPSKAAPTSGAVAVDTLHGPAIPDRPWAKLIAGKQPAVSPLARCVPHDFYLAEFRSIDRLVSALDAGRAWLGFLSVQTVQDATDRPVRRRLQSQLAFDIQDPALVPLVERVAIAGSDPFVAEGSDVTLLIQLNGQPEAIEGFRTRTRRALTDAAGQPGAGTTTGSYLGIDYTYVATADHRISAFAVTLPDRRLHVRSNSRSALHRVIAATLGKDVQPLSATDEYKYIRTLLPLGDNEEDGLVYLPRAFLRRAVGPAVQITEARRLIGYNHLRMIANAAQLYRTKFGKAPTSLDDLTRGECAPGTFNEGSLASPFPAGQYSLSADGVTGVCSVLDTADNLRPCSELLVDKATPEEAASYAEFARTFTSAGPLGLVPVALRLQTGTRQLRAEAILMPPDDHPVRQALTKMLGDRPEPLDPLPVPRRTIASISLRLNKERWLRDNVGPLPPRRLAAISQLGAALAAAVSAPFPAWTPWPALLASASHELLIPAPAPLAHLEQLGIEPAMLRTLLEHGIGNQAGLHFYDSASTFDLSLPTLAANLLGTKDRRELGLLYELGFFAGTLSSPAYVAIPVTDTKIVDDFLTRLDVGLARTVPTWRDHLLGTNLQGEFYHLGSKPGLAVRALGVRAGPVRYRVFWARIGDGLYIANQPGILDDLLAATRERSRLAGSDRGPAGQALLKLRPAGWSLALPGMRLGWEEANREACQRNLAQLSAAARAFSFTPPVSTVALDQETRQRLVLKHAAELYGCNFACPDGGQYRLAEDGKSFSCTIHGSAQQPRQPAQPSPSVAERVADVTATLTLTPDGMRLVLTLKQK